MVSVVAAMEKQLTSCVRGSNWVTADTSTSSPPSSPSEHVKSGKYKKTVERYLVGVLKGRTDLFSERKYGRIHSPSVADGCVGLDKKK